MARHFCAKNELSDVMRNKWLALKSCRANISNYSKKMVYHEVMPRMYFMAERVGFEPTVTFQPHRFSRATYSTTLAPLHKLNRLAAL